VIEDHLTIILWVIIRSSIRQYGWLLAD